MRKSFFDFQIFVEKILSFDDYDYRKLMTNYENKLKNFGKFLKIHYPATTTVSLSSIRNIFLERTDILYEQWYKWHVKFLTILKEDLYKSAQCEFSEWIRMNYAVKVLMRGMCKEDTKTLDKDFFIFLDQLNAFEKDLYLRIINSETKELDCMIRLSTSKLNNEWYKWENKKKPPSRLQNTLSVNTTNNLMTFLNN